MSRTDSGFPDLRTFLQELRRSNDLVEVSTEVDPRLEIAEIHRRVISAGGPALLFTRVKGSPFPVVTNLFGTEARVRTAFGPRPHRLIRRLVQLAETLFPPTAKGLWSARDAGRELFRIGIRRAGSGPVNQVEETDVRLDRLPALTTWAKDGGPFVTLPLVYTEHPETGVPNLGMYRLQIHDRRTTGMHWQIGKGGGYHYSVAEARNEPLPVTVFLGGPPALILSAIAPLPENVPEMMLASLIAGTRLKTVPGPDSHRLVAEAEFAITGRVPPGLRLPEGPFGDHYGYYSLEHDFPVMQVSQLSRRKDAIFPATVVGKPRQEDFYIGDLLQELLSPLFPMVMPGVVDLWSYGETGYHSLAGAVVRERYHREAMASAFRILGEGQLSLTKFLLLTDGRVDLRDFRSTLEHILERTRPETDLFIFPNLAMDTLDYSGPRLNRGSKGVWLGLGDPVRNLPEEFRPGADPPHDVTSVHVFCRGCLVIGAGSVSEDPDAGTRLASHPAFEGWPLIILSDEPERTAGSDMNFLWSTFTRFDPASDIHAATTQATANHLCLGPPILIDARVKPGFPEELFCDPETSNTVTHRWAEYFPPGRKRVEMGDSRQADLD